MTTDWSYLSYYLATMGIPSEVTEDVAVNETADPRSPADGEEIIRLTITKADAGRLTQLVKQGSGSVLNPSALEAAAKVLADNDGIEILQWHKDLARRVVRAFLDHEETR